MHNHHPHHEPVPSPDTSQPVMPEEGASQARWGAIAITIWYLGGFVLLMAGLVAEIGPTAAMQGWMSRHLGWDSPVAAFVPAFAVLALPVLLLRAMPRQTARPFLRGAQDAFPPGTGRAPTDAELAARLGVCAKVMLVIAIASLVAGIVAFTIVGRRPADAGKPLPRRTIAQLLTQRGPLPSYARLIGLNAGTRPIWVRLWSIRQTAYEDIYFPLDDASSHGAITHVVGLASFVRGTDDEPHRRDLVVDLPMDGSPSRTLLPAWRRDEMAQRGFPVSDHVILFRQDRTLSGVYPGGDVIGAIAALAIGGCAALIALAIAARCLIVRRRLLRANVPQHLSRRPRHSTRP